MDRLFLDATVLFSAAYRVKAGLLRLWDLPDATLFTSTYAADEARVNHQEPDQRVRLSELLQAMTVVAALPDHPLPKGVVLPTKDQPILLAAIATRATHLLTGDVRDFGRYYGQTVAGILILPPSEYLRGRRKS